MHFFIINKLNISMRGYYNYYAVNDNMDTMRRFRHKVIWSLYYWMNRRSQRRNLSWDRFSRMLNYTPIVKPQMRHVLYDSVS